MNNASVYHILINPSCIHLMQRTIDGKNYWTFEYELESSGFSRTAFATIAIGNGMYYYYNLLSFFTK